MNLQYDKRTIFIFLVSTSISSLYFNINNNQLNLNIISEDKEEIKIIIQNILYNLAGLAIAKTNIKLQSYNSTTIYCSHQTTITTEPLTPHTHIHRHTYTQPLSASSSCASECARRTCLQPNHSSICNCEPLITVIIRLCNSTA